MQPHRARDQMKRAVVVTGLPASGKSTVARQLANALNFAFLDKDDFLEALYDQRGVGALENRKRLSRESDQLFEQAAKNTPSAVLVSHWRAIGSTEESGTPSDWLLDHYDSLVEVCCLCPVEEALSRFFSRQRHPGHADGQRDKSALRQQFKDWNDRFPIGLPNLLSIQTDRTVDISALASDLQSALDAGDL